MKINSCDMGMKSDKLSTRNVQVGGGRTTIAVEPECWQMLIEISRQQKTTLRALIPSSFFGFT
jgi:predicted DNA-binding ribbon-helix-helix protein